MYVFDGLKRPSALRDSVLDTIGACHQWYQAIIKIRIMIYYKSREIMHFLIQFSYCVSSQILQARQTDRLGNLPTEKYQDMNFLSVLECSCSPRS